MASTDPISAAEPAEEIKDGEQVVAEGSPTEVSESDLRSVFVGNVHFKATDEELRELFNECGDIERITIAMDKTGYSKGYAFIEFKDQKDAEKALSLEGALIHNRKIKVIPKR
jgi:polyadenylate-binding protein 2